jgi:hypothetical protein
MNDDRRRTGIRCLFVLLCGFEILAQTGKLRRRSGAACHSAHQDTFTPWALRARCGSVQTAIDTGLSDALPRVYS